MSRVNHVPIIWLSLSMRAKVSNEALNMVEAVGNYIRRRRAPIPVLRSSERGSEFVVVYAPAISGETIAHAWQEWIAYIAQSKGLRICDRCAQGYFIKRGDAVGRIQDPDAYEVDAIKSCVVEDVGGFLAPTEPPVKRTSRIYTGYAIPSLMDLDASAIEPQMHARHAPPAAILKGGQVKPQMLYTVETASAVYAFQFSVDISGIGRQSYASRSLVVGIDEKKKRVETVIEALYQVAAQGMMGAKRTRFDPYYSVLSAVASVSVGIAFNATPAHSEDYVVQTAERAKSVLGILSVSPLEIHVVSYVGEEDAKRGVKAPQEAAVSNGGKVLQVKAVGTMEELFAKLKEVSLSAIDRYEGAAAAGARQ